MRATSPLHPLDTASPSSTASSASGANENFSLRSSMRCEWSEWEENLDAVSGGFLGVSTADVYFDQFLLANVDDFFEPVADTSVKPDSPNFAADLDFLDEQEQDLDMLRDATLDMGLGGSAQLRSIVAQKLEPQSLPTTTDSDGHRPHKRKTVELHKHRGETNRHTHASKKIKKPERLNASNKCETEAKYQTEMVYRRRYDILHKILEVWNTGGIEDMEEIADNVYENDVTLISPNFSDGLHGVEAVMLHWNQLLDVFPDGIMEEYVIERGGGSNETLKATWTFSGTQIYPILGVQPRHKKVCINGTSYFTFLGDRIRQMVLSWNLRETQLKLMGVQPDKAKNAALGVSVASIDSTVQMPHSGAIRS